jgi:polypyrimidine tract-binding protein 1
MKDYIALNLYCFKKSGPKNYSNINPPSSTLHLSNIPLSVEENGLKQAFLMDNLNVQPFKFFPNDCKMVLVQLALVEGAITALFMPDNYQLTQTSHLRVSFSTSTI